MHMTDRAPHTQAELILALTRSKQDVAVFFAGIDTGSFFAHPEGVWSAAENLDHLIRAVSPVAKALRIPRLLTRLAFGAAKSPARDYAAIAQAYTEQLREGGAASGRVMPQIEAQPADSAAARQQLLNAWREACDKLSVIVGTWSEADLDVHQLPHPLLGNLTVREMLFFTLYHNGHHVRQTRDVLEQLRSGAAGR